MRVVEQHGVLRHDADGRAQARLGDVADVLPVERDAPAVHVVEAEQQPRQRGLARPAVPDHRHRRARGNLEAHVEQDLAPAARS